jgi:EmrB/QacA subfamily drug resistance transporter
LAENKIDGISSLIPLRYSFTMTILAMMIGGFMAFLDSSIVNVALPAMMNNFGVGTTEIEWVVTIYMLVLGMIVPLSGWLGDFLGFKTLYLGALAVFTLGSALCAFAWSVNSLIFFRALQAIGGGMIMPTMMSMIYRIAPRDRIGSAMGSFGLVMVVAPSLGPTLGGYLVEYVSWRWIFSINIPIGILGLLFAFLVLPEFKRGKAGKFDWWGALMICSGMYCLLYVLSKGQTWGWTSETSLFYFYFSIVLLGFFIYHELHTPEPLLELRVFKNSIFSIGNLVLVSITMGMYGGLFYIPLFLQSIKGLGALQAGVLSLPPALVTGVMMPLSGRLYDKVGPKPLVLSGIVVITVTNLLFSRIDIDTDLSTIVFWNCLRSFGMGLCMMPIQTALMSEIPTHLVGRASSITNIIRQIAGSFGIAVLVTFVTNRTSLHVANLSWSVTAANPLLAGQLQDLTQTLVGCGVSAQAAQSTLLTTIMGKISQIGVVQAIDDMFIITAAITVFTILPALVLRKGNMAKASSTIIE